MGVSPVLWTLPVCTWCVAVKEHHVSTPTLITVQFLITYCLIVSCLNLLSPDMLLDFSDVLQVRTGGNDFIIQVLSFIR